MRISFSCICLVVTFLSGSAQRNSVSLSTFLYLRTLNSQQAKRWLISQHFSLANVQPAGDSLKITYLDTQSDERGNHDALFLAYTTVMSQAHYISYSTNLTRFNQLKSSLTVYGFQAAGISSDYTGNQIFIYRNKENHLEFSRIWSQRIRDYIYCVTYQTGSTAWHK